MKKIVAPLRKKNLYHYGIKNQYEILTSAELGISPLPCVKVDNVLHLQKYVKNHNFDKCFRSDLQLAWCFTELDFLAVTASRVQLVFHFLFKLHSNTKRHG